MTMSVGEEGVKKWIKTDFNSNCWYCAALEKAAQKMNVNFYQMEQTINAISVPNYMAIMGCYDQISNIVFIFNIVITIIT